MQAHKFRFAIFYIGIILFGLILVGRLFDIQILDSNDYVQKTMRQQARTTGNIYDRGTIYLQERTGTLLSAANLQTGYTLAVHPNQITDPEITLSFLPESLNIDEDKFMQKVANSDDPYEEISTRLPKDVAEEIMSKKLNGVSVYEQKWRYYPGDNLASHVIGFVGYDKDKVVGRYGVEKFQEDTLKRDNPDVYKNFIIKLFSDIGSTVFSHRSEGDVVLTIEPRVQTYFEKILKETSEKWKAEKIGGIIINPTNGEIIAMGVYPNFNPNEYGKELDQGIFPNPLVENVYEMGSTFKPLTLAAAIDAKSINTDMTYEDKGTLTLNGKKISNYDKKARGVVKIQEILNQSLNTGTVFAMQKMGRELFRKYMYAYGIADKTGIDLPNESAGLTDNLNSNEDIDYATMSFGQGLAITPIAMTRALGALANGGVLVKPHVTSSIKNGSRFNEKREIIEQGRVISKESSEIITRMLVEVVDKALLNGSVKMEHYSIAAKTGTAQVAKPTGGYYDDRYNHTFFGYFPAYQPQFLVFIFMQNPTGAEYASQTLTTSFMDTTRFLINYYEISPDR